MLPYYILVGIPFFCSLFSYINQDELHIKKKNYEVIVFFALYFIILSLRDITIGVDLTSYSYYYEQIGNIQWNDLKNYNLEFGYVLLNKIIYSLGFDFNFFLSIVALIVCIPTAYLYKKESDDGVITILLYLTSTSIFVLNFSGLRQVIAITFAVPAYYAVKNKKLIRFLIFVFLASLFHISAWIMVAMYPAYRIKIEKRGLFVIAPILLLIFIFRIPIFNFLLQFLSDKYQDLYGKTTQTGAVMMIILLGLFVVFSFVFTDEEKIDDDTNGLRVFLIISFALQLFSTVHYIAMRFNYYYLLFLPITITKVMSNSNKQDKSFVMIIKIIFVLFFTFYFFYSAYMDEDILQVFPYKSFLSE